jgi:hypothetical protein
VLFCGVLLRFSFCWTAKSSLPDGDSSDFSICFCLSVSSNQFSNPLSQTIRNPLSLISRFFCFRSTLCLMQLQSKRLVFCADRPWSRKKARGTLYEKKKSGKKYKNRDLLPRIDRIDAVKKSSTCHPLKPHNSAFENLPVSRSSWGQGGFAPLRGVGQRPTKKDGQRPTKKDGQRPTKKKRTVKKRGRGSTRQGT